VKGVPYQQAFAEGDVTLKTAPPFTIHGKRNEYLYPSYPITPNRLNPHQKNINIHTAASLYDKSPHVYRAEPR